MAVVHSKVDQIPDWAQEQLNNQIALGNYPAGTTLADIVLPSDWNDGHNIDVTTYQTETDAGDAVSQLAMNMRAAITVDMGNDNYTLTDTEAQASGLLIINSGSGKTLTYPTSSNYKSGAVVAILMAFAANPISVVHASAGAPVTINNPAVDYITIATGVGISLMSSAFVSDTAYASSWSGVDYSAPSKDAVYNKLETMSDNAITQNFLLMGG